ncbi:hypothetical protein [Streptomyces aureocirculatus]|uniref:hypothetical protein n=1 Tax=Streptomyces aureocirculatus TaxID=67275 RepID=UPI0018FF089E|nr:hypothetical protein [Streptomyces aureocirculatus]
MLQSLRVVYMTPSQAREAGYLELDHFGASFRGSNSHYDLSGVSQRWLRDLLWDYLANLLRTPSSPRTRSPYNDMRRACLELSCFLEVDTDGGGHDPEVLRAEHVHRFVIYTRAEGYAFSADPNELESYETARVHVLLTEVRRLITGTIAPHAALDPEDKRVRHIVAQLNSVESTLDLIA